MVESGEYTYNLSNQLVSAKLYDGKKNTTMKYTYDGDGNLIAEDGTIGTDKVEKDYIYTVENRLKAVYDGDDLLVAMAYDGDGNRLFQLNYNLHTDDDWDGNSGNGNGNNKDNGGNGKSLLESIIDFFTGGEEEESTETTAELTATPSTYARGNNGNGSGNTNNTDGSQNQSGILFPEEGEVSELEEELIGLIKTEGHQKNYELIEYVNDVNRENEEVLMELNINGKMDTAYSYGNERLTVERFDGWTGYYTYDPRGSVSGVTGNDGYLWQSYRYDVFGGITFGGPQYNNAYAYNAESYNPNLDNIYLRARYYYTATAAFMSEDSYLGDISDPLSLNRYNYVKSSYLNYMDPSGHDVMSPEDIMTPDGHNLGSYFQSTDKNLSKKIKDHLGEDNRTLNLFSGFGVETKIELAEQAGETETCDFETIARSIVSFVKGMRVELGNYPSNFGALWAEPGVDIGLDIGGSEEMFAEWLGNSKAYYMGKYTAAFFMNWLLNKENSLLDAIARAADGNPFGDEILAGMTFSGILNGSGSTALADAGMGAGGAAVSTGALIVSLALKGIGEITITFAHVLKTGNSIQMYQSQDAMNEAYNKIQESQKKESDSKIPQKAKDALDKIDKDPDSYLEDHNGNYPFRDEPNKAKGETKIPNRNIAT